MPEKPKHTQGCKVTPRISYGRVDVETQRENTSDLDFENNWQTKCQANSTRKPNV